tara:strand:- start:1150 stop:1587 length:438 start_codon:yes stop_codon:yes gene_type:complete
VLDRDFLDSLDLSDIKNKFVYKYKWTKVEAQECEKLYKNYLYLSYKYFKKNKLVPTNEVDLFWHEHILDTNKYINDCNSLFGEYLHHYPSYSFGKKNKNNPNHQSLFNNTQELHKKNFGYYMYDIKTSWTRLIWTLVKKVFKRSS